jgi:hypothetical protein
LGFPKKSLANDGLSELMPHYYPFKTGFAIILKFHGLPKRPDHPKVFQRVKRAGEKLNGWK